MQKIFVIILLLNYSLSNAQIKIGTYQAKTDSTIYLSLNSDSKYEMGGPQCCYASGYFYWGSWFYKNDTLVLSYNHLKMKENSDTTKTPAEYTDYSGNTYKITNAFIIKETKKYLFNNNSLTLIKDDESNKLSDWGNFDFTLIKN